MMIKKKILVIDDEKDILDIVALLLEAKGFEVFAYDRVDNLIEKINKHQPNIILLDVQLGELDGRLLCKGIKELKEHAHIPIVLFSANTHYRKDIQDFHCDEFIEKPFGINEFVNRIVFHTEKAAAQDVASIEE